VDNLWITLNLSRIFKWIFGRISFPEPSPHADRCPGFPAKYFPSLAESSKKRCDRATWPAKNIFSVLVINCQKKG
jgi:hypothetical protein